MGSNTVVQALLDRAAALASRPVLWREEGDAVRPVLWREGLQQVTRLAHGLVAAGLEPGEAVGILGGADWPLVALAAMASGGVPAVLDPRWPREALASAAASSRLRFLAVGAGHEERGAALRDGLPQLRGAVSPDGGGGMPALASLLQSGDGLPAGTLRARLERLESASPGAVFFSGGTGGAPRSAIASHANLLWTTAQLSRLIGISRNDVLLSLLPPAHAAALTAGLLLPTTCGAQLYLGAGDELPLGLLREARPTIVLGPPSFWEALRKAIAQRFEQEPPNRLKVTEWARGLALERHRLDSEQKTVSPSLMAKCRLAATLVHEPLKVALGLDRARVLLCAGGAVSQTALEFFASIDAPLFELYGQAESCGVSAACVPGSARIGSQGRPLPGGEVRLADDGEIWLRGGNLVPGERPEGWLRTGDLGRLDCQGFLHVDGRRSELLTGAEGQLLSPRRIEARLQGIPAVHQAAVFARDGRLGALLTLDRAEARRRALQLGLPADADALVEEPVFKEWLRQQLDGHCAALPPRERVTLFELQAAPFSVEAGELGTGGEPRREAIALRREAALRRLFEDERPRLRPLTA